MCAYFLINLYLSRLVRKPTICICENKGTDQLGSNCEADQRLSFRYSESTFLYVLNPKLPASSHFCACTAGFVSDLFKTTLLVFSQDGSRSCNGHFAIQGHLVHAPCTKFSAKFIRRLLNCASKLF